MSDNKIRIKKLDTANRMVFHSVQRSFFGPLSSGTANMSKFDSEEIRPKKNAVPLDDKGEHQIFYEESPSEAPADKKIHPRRPLPLVPAKKAHNNDPERDLSGD